MPRRYPAMTDVMRRGGRQDVDRGGWGVQSEGMSRALVALAGASLLALLFGVGRADHPVVAVALALVFTLIATAGFAWVRERGLRFRAAYFAVQLPLGVLVFGLAGATTGGALML